MSYRRRQTPGVSLADWLTKIERLAAVSSIRFVRRRDSHGLKASPAKISELSATVGDAAAHPNRPRMTRMGTDKNIREIRAIRGQESVRRLNVTVSGQTCERRRTTELSHAGNRATNRAGSTDPTQTRTGVGSSDLVRRRVHNPQISSGQIWRHSRWRPPLPRRGEA